MFFGLSFAFPLLPTAVLLALDLIWFFGLLVFFFYLYWRQRPR